MLVEIREDPDADPIFSTTVRVTGIGHDADMEEIYSWAWQEAVEAGIVPADSDYNDYFFQAV